MNIMHFTSGSGSIVYTKIINIPYSPVFCAFVELKSLEIFPKHNGYGTIPLSATLNLITSLLLTNK